MSGHGYTQKKVLLKIIILGESGVGKTAILHQYVMGKFVEEHKATIGADFLTKEVSIDDYMVTLQIWDTAGQERFQALGNAFYRGSDACVLVYDISSLDSFKALDNWKTNFLNQTMPDDPQTFPFLLLGNKSDLNQRAISLQDGKAYADKHNMLFYETSALNGANISAAMNDMASAASAMDHVPWFTAAVDREVNSQPVILDGGSVGSEVGSTVNCWDCIA